MLSAFGVLFVFFSFSAPGENCMCGDPNKVRECVKLSLEVDLWRGVATGLAKKFAVLRSLH